MKRFTLSGIKASLENMENKNPISLESEDTESSDVIDEALSKNTTSEAEENTEEGSEEPSESSDDTTEESEAPVEEPVTETEIDTEAEENTEEGSEEPSESSDDTTEESEEEKPEATLDDLPNNVELTETEISVDVKSPEESATEVSNKELALDMEEVGALESLVEVLNSSYGNTSSHTNKLAVTNLKLSYGLEAFGLPDSFEINTDRDKAHFVKVVSSAIDNNREGTYSTGLEAINVNVSVNLKKLKEWLLALVRATVDMFGKLLEKFKKFIKSMVSSISVRYKNIKKAANKIKADVSGNFIYSPSIENIEGSVFDKQNKIRVANILKTLSDSKDIVDEYFAVFMLIKRAISLGTFEIDKTELSGKRFTDINRSIDSIKTTMNKDFGNVVSTVSTALGVDGETTEVNRLVVNRNFEHGIEVEMSTKDIVSLILSLEKDFNKAQATGESVSSLTDSIWVASKQFKIDLEKADVGSRVSDNIPEMSSRIRGLHSLILMSSKNITANTTFVSKTLKGIGQFIEATESHLVKNAEEDIVMDKVPSTESFSEKGIELANNVKDPIVSLESIAYNIESIQ